MRGRRSRTSLRRDRRGNVSMIVAGSLVMLIGMSALGVDTGTIFLEKRRLQGIADAAALSAASDPANGGSYAQAAVQANAHGDAHITALQSGSYTPDTGIAVSARFVAGGTPANAARVTLESSVPTFFARVFGTRTVAVSARSTASRIDLAGFSIGSRLVGVNGGLPGALLSQLAGTDLNISLLDYNALVGGQVDILKTAQILRTTVGLQAATFGEVLDSDVALPAILNAMAGATTNATTAATLRAIALRVPGRTVKLSTVIDLGPLSANLQSDPNRTISTDAYSLLREALGIGGGARQLSLAIDLGVPGIIGSTIWVATGERPVSTPWLAVSSAGGTVVRTAQTRVWIDLKIAAPLGLGTVRVPVFVELATAQATLQNVNCANGRANATATLAITPSAGDIAIADLDPSGLNNFSRAMALRPAQILSLPLISATAFSDITLGGAQSQNVTFSASDIANHTVRSVSTNDVASGVAESLLQHVDLRANVLGIGLSASAITSAVASTLAVAAPAIDTVIDQVTSLAGVHVGQADAWVNGVRCGTPTIVN